MIIVMKGDATEKQVEAIIELLDSRNFDVHRSTGVAKVVLGVVGTGLKDVEQRVRSMDGVEQVIRITQDPE